MTQAVPICEIWRGGIIESQHLGHAVICGADGLIREAWGNPDLAVLPRSSAKMIQALPLIESGAAAARGLASAHLALACASHNGAAIHTDPVQAWLADLGLGDDDLRCGGHMPKDETAAHGLIKTDISPCQYHNNCSGKHAGFLTLGDHLGAGPEYIDPKHPVQLAVQEALESLTDTGPMGYGIDGCSAPNFITTMHGMARAMATFAGAGGSTRGDAMQRLWQAMIKHPELVAGEGRACTLLMRACSEPVALKTGAEGFFIAILPSQGLGIAVKATDGTTRAAECAIAALLVRLGVLDVAHPAAMKFMTPPILNCRGLTTGMIRPASGLVS